MLYIKADNTTPPVNYETNIIYSILLDNHIDNTHPPINWSFLLELTNDFTKKTFTQLMIMHDSALRYNRNMVAYPIAANIGGVGNGLTQKIAFDNTGYYSYKIYYQDSLTNLIPANIVGTTEPVQVGKALVYTDKSELKYASQTDGSPTNFIYVP